MHVCGFGKMLSDLLSEKCHSPFTQPEEGKMIANGAARRETAKASISCYSLVCFDSFLLQTHDCYNKALTVPLCTYRSLLFCH